MFKAQNELQNRNLRSLVFMAAVALVFSCLSVRLLYLQYARYEENLQSSDENRLRRIVLKAERGLIFDRNGTLLVGNRPSYQIVIKPAEIRKMDAETKDSLFKRLIHLKDSQGDFRFCGGRYDVPAFRVEVAWDASHFGRCVGRTGLYCARTFF